MGAREAGLALLAIAVLGALAVVGLAVVHRSVEPVLVTVACLGLVAAVGVVLADRRRAPRG